MKNKLILLIMFVFCFGIIGSANVYAATSETYGNLTYTVSGGAITITDCKTTATSVEIPSTIDGIPVKYIGSYAFERCSSLRKITIGSNVVSIGDYAFMDCALLSEITINSNVYSIGKSAFIRCQTLKKVNLNGSPSIGKMAFYNCNNLEVLNVSSLETFLKCQFGDSDSNPIKNAESFCIANKEITQLVIPEGTTNIGDYAFYGCTSINGVSFPSSVTNIGSYAFSNCSFDDVTFVPGITNIASSAFYGADIDNVWYSGSESSWNKVTIGTYNDVLENVKCFCQVTLIDPQGNSIVERYSSNQLIDLEALENKYEHEVKIYFDDELKNEFDITTAFTENTTLYIGLGSKIEKYFNINNASLSNFKDTITPTGNNTQSVELTLNGKKLKKDVDYAVWYSNNLFKGTAKMLIIGIGEYTGYIEKEYEISGDISVSLGSTVYIKPNESVLLDTTVSIDEEFKKWSYEYNGQTISQSSSDTITGKNKTYDEGKHVIYYTTTVTEFIGISGNGTPTYSKTPREYKTTIYAYDEDVRLVEISQILDSGRDKIFLQPKITPIYANNQELTWSTTNSDVAIVDDYGVVTLKKAGSATITATANNGEKLDVELDIEPLKISNATVKSINKSDDSSYTIILEDKYGVLREDVDYNVTYSVESDVLTVEIKGVGLYSGRLIKGYKIADMTETKPILKYLLGDINGNETVELDDAIALFQYSMLPDIYPIEYTGDVDFDKNGAVDLDDAILLFQYSMLPDLYPIE